MNENQLRDKEKSLSVKYSPVPEFVTCPKCAEEIELWSGSIETICFFCGHKVFKRETTVH